MSGIVFDVLLTNQTRNFSSFFHGRAFEGPDLVIGSEGWKKRIHEKKSEFLPEEGAYIYCHGSGQEKYVETDPFGFCKLYIYQNGKQWAISDSAALLCDWAHKNGLELSIHKPALGYLRSPWDIGDQPMSHQTLFEQITLIPIWSSVRITNHELQIIKSRHYESIRLESTYEDSLRSFLIRTRNRLLTILESNDVETYIQISGGIDSRVILAIAHSLGVDYSLYTKEYLAGLELDTKIAGEVAEKLNVELGTNPPQLNFYDYETWRKQQLSTFKTFYLKRNFPLNVLVVGGGSGELFRKRYDFDFRLLGKYSGHKRLFNGDVSNYYSAFREFESTCIYSKSQLFGDVTFGKCYYRALRHRFHYGQDEVIKPFADLRFVSFIDKAFNGQRGSDYRVYHEIIASLAPELLDVEFDDSKKACPRVEFSELLQIDKLPKPIAGRVWIGEKLSEENKKVTIDEFSSKMKIEFEKALVNVPLTKYMTEDEISEAKGKLNRFVNGKKLSQRELRLVQFILSLGLAYPKAH